MRDCYLLICAAIWLAFAFIVGLIFCEFEWARMGFILSSAFLIGQYLTYKIDKK